MTLPTIELAPPPETAAESRPAAAGEWPNPYDAPLKVVALALRSLRGRGKASEIKRAVMSNTALTEQEYKAWWDGIPTVLRAAPDFKEQNGTYSLLGSPDSVPAAPLPPKPKKAKAPAKPKPKPGTAKEWEAWLSAKADAPPPADFPHSAFIKGIAAKPKKFPEHALHRVVYGANDALADDKVDRPDAWLNMLMAVAQRWNKEFSNTRTEAPSGAAAASFYLRRAIPAGKGRQDLKRDAIREFVALLTDDGSVKRALTAEVWSLLQQGSEDVDELRQEFAQALDRNGQADFWHEIIAAGLNAGNSDRLIAAILGALKRRDDAGYRQVLHLLLLKAARGEIADRDALLECLREDSPFWVSGLLMLNSDNERSLMQGAERIYSGVAYGGDLNAMESWDDENAVKAEANDSKPSSPEDAFRELTKHVGNQIDAQKRRNRVAFLDRLDEQKDNHQQELILRDRQFANYRDDVRRQREESRFEIRKDMLLVVGETLRSLISDDAEDSARLRDALSGLKLTLRTGGGELIGDVGETVAYNPAYHQPNTPMAQGTPAQVDVPGMLVRSGLAGEQVLFMAKVSGLQEAN